MEHERRRQPEPSKVYIAGIDLAGEAEEGEGASLRILKPRQDSTVVTIGELDFSSCNKVIKQPRINIVEHYWWTGRKHAELYPQLMDVLKTVRRGSKVVVDSTGGGPQVASFLRQSLGSKVSPFTFTAQSKSGLGFALLAAINSGRVKMYAGDGSPEYEEFWSEMEMARSQYRPNQTVNFYVDPTQGHDDFLMSLALLVEAASQYSPRSARGVKQEHQPFQ